MKRIEDLTQDDITEAGDIELHRWRSSFCQVFEKRQAANKEIDMMLPGYVFLTDTMRDRGLVWKAHDIDMALFEIRVAGSDDQSEAEADEEVMVDAPDIEKVDVNIISKSDDDEHIVFGVVYEPDEEDTQGDYATEEEIRKAAYTFMENGQDYLVMHKGTPADVCVLESYLAPVGFSVGEETVKKGSWMLTSRINDAEMWVDIKSGEFTGYSMGGTSER